MLDPSRLRRYQILLYVAVSALVAGAVSVPLGARVLTAAGYIGLGLVSALLHRGVGRPSWRRTAVALALDLAAHAFVVFRMGGFEGPNPYFLLFALPILVWGLVGGPLGGLGSASGTVLALLVRFFAQRRIDLESTEGPESLETLGLHLASFILLGIFVSFLGRRLQRDRAEHERTQRELEQMQLDAESIVSSLVSGLLCLDSEGRVRRLSWRAKDLLGIKRWIDFGAPVRSVLPAPEWQDLAAHLERCLARGVHDVSERVFPGGRTEQPLEVATTPILGPNGEVRGLVVLFSDLTERKAREAAEKRRERLALIGQLSAGLAHEIRNSLKPITGSVEMLRADGVATGPAADSLMDIILREAENLESFLTEFLSFARDKTLTVEPLSLESVLVEEFEGLRTLSARPLRLLLPEDGERGSWVRADRSALGQVLRNLGVNAIEATEDDSGEIEMGWSDEGDEILVFVRDRGCGISPETQGRVFDPFFTTKPSGTGLGLAIVRDLVERMGGEIRLDPRPGGGTLAALRFDKTEPVSRDDRPVAEESRARAA